MLCIPQIASIRIPLNFWRRLAGAKSTDDEQL